MTTSFLRIGSDYLQTDKKQFELVDTLPAGNYKLGMNQKGDYTLTPVESFKIPSKIYGDIEKQAERIINTFSSRDHSTGVLLGGEKGSGKTLLAKLICAQLNVLTILVGEPFCGSSFNSFIQGIEQPCVIFFDEFEKVYDDEQQEAILTLLDGTLSSKKLYLFTCNDIYGIDTNMKNRPGRIFYFLKFKGLDASFVEQYAAENLKQELHQYVHQLIKLSTISTLNFDSLYALCEEMNRYNESPIDSLKMLNIKAEAASKKYKASLLKGGIHVDDFKPIKISFSPFNLNENSENDYYLFDLDNWYNLEGKNYLEGLIVYSTDLISADYKEEVYKFKFKTHLRDNENDEILNKVELVLELRPEMNLVYNI